MTFVTTPLMVDGALHSAQLYRLMLQAMASGNSGVITGGACKVRAATTPGAEVIVGDGGVLVGGAIDPWQGSYYGWNIGDEPVPVAATGATGRSDLIVTRVADPDYEGTLNPAVDRTIYPDVISNVPAGTKKAPAGSGTVEVLARVDIPANTAAFTDAMIVDLRRIAAPRWKHVIEHLPAGTWDTLNFVDGTWERFPNGCAFQIDIPSWATVAKVTGFLEGIKIYTGGWGSLRININGVGATQSTNVNEDADITGSYDRRAYPLGGEITIAAADRGTTQTIQIEGNKGVGSPTFLATDAYSSGQIQVWFEEGRI